MKQRHVIVNHEFKNTTLGDAQYILRRIAEENDAEWEDIPYIDGLVAQDIIEYLNLENRRLHEARKYLENFAIYSFNKIHRRPNSIWSRIKCLLGFHDLYWTPDSMDCRFCEKSYPASDYIFP